MRRGGELRGNAADRRRRKLYLLDKFGDGTVVVCAGDACTTVLTFETLTVDRIVMGCDGGRYTRDNIVPKCRPCNSSEGGRVGAARNLTHAQMVDEYRAARDARDALRESGLTVMGAVAGAAGSGICYSQLSDDEFNELHPPLTFKAWLVDWAASRREDAQAAPQGVQASWAS